MHQARVRARGDRTATRIIERWRDHREKPHVWFTYHLYHKAPDWIGPPVCRALDIPYVVAEASHAPKQASGRWAEGFLAAKNALRQASAIFALSTDDAEGLRKALGPTAPIHRLPPFLDARPYVRASKGRASARAKWMPSDAVGPLLLAVGMMRTGDKQASYTVLANAMARLNDRPWHLVLVGFGPETDAIVSMFHQDRIRHIGRLDPTELATLYAGADLFVWPAVNEAFGMVLLEAQATGLAVVAGDGRGVPGIVDADRTGLLTPVGDPAPFADAVARLMDDPTLRRQMGRDAQHYILAHHGLDAASNHLNKVITDVAG